MSSDGIAAAFLFFFVLLVEFSGAGAQPNPGMPDDPYQYARFSPSMAIIVVVLIAALFFMAFFSIYIRHCNDGSAGSVRPIAGAAGVRSRRAAALARGLDAEAIEKFPTFAYSEVKDLKIGKGALECAVCLCEFDDDETLRLIPKCDHVFHPECIDAWLASHTTCPVCRADLGVEIPAGESIDSPAGATETSEHEHEVSVAVESQSQENDHVEVQVRPVEPDLVNQNRTRGSQSGRPRKFPRSHSTGHSLVQPGDDTERFTLRLPVEVRKQIMANRMLNRATSMVVLPREGSSRRGYRDGSIRGGKSYRRLDSFGPAAKSDRWVFTMAPPFFVRQSSIKSPKLADQGTSDSPKAGSFFTRAFSIKLGKPAAREEGSSGSSRGKSQPIESTRPPV